MFSLVRRSICLIIIVNVCLCFSKPNYKCQWVPFYLSSGQHGKACIFLNENQQQIAPEIVFYCSIPQEKQEEKNIIISKGNVLDQSDLFLLVTEN